MPVKDYYQLLEIPRNATEKEIKAAWRKMAMRYHPDKNTGNPIAIQYFRDVQEAYEVLSNPVKRNEYHQLRWQQSFSGERHRPFVLTAAMVLQEAEKLRDQVAAMDVFRMNQDAVVAQLRQLLNSDHIQLVRETGAAGMSARLLDLSLTSLAPLSYPNWVKLLPALLRIAGTDNELLLKIRSAETEKKKQYWWSRYSFVLILLTVILLCGMIYLIA
ncbi:MAG TPA: J domain-containing protein [Flavihumibacter sp.]